MRFTQPPSRKLPDAEAEEARRLFARCVDELQRAAASSVFIKGVELADGVETTIAHALGREPNIIIISAIRGATAAGYINEVRDDTNRERSFKLVASDYGAAIRVDLEVK